MDKTRAKLKTQKNAKFLTSYNDYGGYIDVYIARTEFYTEHDILIRIQGMCMSACVIYTGLEKVCLMPGSYLMLHQGSTPEATDDMMAMMNPDLADYVQENDLLPPYVRNAPDEDDHKNFTRIDADFIIKKGWMKECTNKFPYIPKKKPTS
jgi:hypothetical protein